MQSEVSPLYAKQTYLWFSIELLAQIHNANCYTADWLSCFFNIGRLGGFIFLMEFFWLDTILFDAFVRFERACYMAIWASFRISPRTFILSFFLFWRCIPSVCWWVPNVGFHPGPLPCIPESYVQHPTLSLHLGV